MRAAMHNPRQAFPAGRVKFEYRPEYLNGTMFCFLPSKRALAYRALRWENIPVLDEDDKPTGEVKLELTFARGYGRMKIWPGLFVENVTQAVAADFLRGTLVRLESAGYRTRLHTHDEILLEAAPKQAETTAAVLRVFMQRGFSWSTGLPIMSEETIAYYYTKHEGSHGL